MNNHEEVFKSLKLIWKNYLIFILANKNLQYPVPTVSYITDRSYKYVLFRVVQKVA